MCIRDRFTPILVNLEYGEKLCIAEADVEDYPGMYLATDSCRPQLRGAFAPYPKSVVQGGHNDLEHLVTSRYPYIAKINAPRTFPWRTFIVTRRDGELMENDMVYRLAAPSRVTDRSWIKPGKVAWEWLNDCGLYVVDFKAGINTETYKSVSYTHLDVYKRQPLRSPSENVYPPDRRIRLRCYPYKKKDRCDIWLHFPAIWGNFGWQRGYLQGL